MVKHSSQILTLLLVLHVLERATSGEPFRYPEAVHGKGELKYVNGVPLLVVQGEPGEIGEQVGVLSVKPASNLFKLAPEFLQTQGIERMYPALLKMCNFMALRFPVAHLSELEATAKASGQPRGLFLFGNAFPDVMEIGGCATLVVEGKRSTTGGPLFGRNLDWPPVGPLCEYALVTVYRPARRHAFASIGYPGMIGCASGINDAGLALAMLDVNRSNDKSARFNPAGIPCLLMLRRILEECTTIGEAEKLVRSVERTTMYNVTLCDKNRAAVLEITSKNVFVRQPEASICVCTNHFRTPGLATSTECGRFRILDKSREIKTLALADVVMQMHAVNQGAATMQTMVFEPSTLTLHLAFGRGPASRLPIHMIPLAKHLGEPQRQKKEL